MMIVQNPLSFQVIPNPPSLNNNNHHHLQDYTNVHSSILLQSTTTRKILFHDLPPELLHIILTYSTHRFEDIIKFSTINRSCKSIADSSLLWLQIPLEFYVTRQFLLMKILHPPSQQLSEENTAYHIPTATTTADNEDINIKEYVNSLINPFTLRIVVLTKEPFEAESIYPPILKVEVAIQETTHLLLSEGGGIAGGGGEMQHEYCFRLRNWFMKLHSEYRLLWDWHIRWHRFFRFILTELQTKLNYTTFLLAPIAFTSSAIFCFSENNNLSNQHGLTVLAQVGFFLIYLTILFYLFLTIVQGIIKIAQSLYYPFTTLKVRFRYTTVFGIDLILYTLIGILASIILVHSKLMNVHGLSWVDVTIPMWITFTIALIVLSMELIEIYAGLIEKITVFLASCYLYSLPLSCTLIAYYFDHAGDDNSNHGGITNLGYTLVPLYPFFFACILLLVGKSLLVISAPYYYFIRGASVGRGLSTRFRSDMFCLLLKLLSFSMCILISFSVIALQISCFKSDESNSRNNWGESWVGVRLSPLVLALLTIDAAQILVVILLLEHKYS